MLRWAGSCLPRSGSMIKYLVLCDDRSFTHSIQLSAMLSGVEDHPALTTKGLFGFQIYFGKREFS